MHASLTTDEPFNGEDNWYFSFKNCTTLIPEIRMNKLLLCQIAVIILISSLQGEWTGLYYLPNPKIRILPNSYPKILKILRSEMTMVSLSPNPTRKFFSPKNPKIKKRVDELRLENLVLVRSWYFAVNRGWQFGGWVGSRKLNHST